jgi:ectoine hydroxylase-related dioxygenase (phytanoyl-CoA dioxygenase family)
MPIHALLPEPHGASADGLPADHAALADCPDQVTLAVDAGDAVVLDYRLLHGTHPNATPDRRDCILLSFTPAWRDLPADIKAHLIAHPALPDASVTLAEPPVGYRHLLPEFNGMPASLPVKRTPPSAFAAN